MLILVIVVNELKITSRLINILSTEARELSQFIEKNVD